MIKRLFHRIESGLPHRLYEFNVFGMFSFDNKHIFYFQHFTTIVSHILLVVPFSSQKSFCLKHEIVFKINSMSSKLRIFKVTTFWMFE